MRTVLRPNPMAPDIDGIEPDARIEGLAELVDLVHLWRAGEPTRMLPRMP